MRLCREHRGEEEEDEEERGRESFVQEFGKEEEGRSRRRGG